MVAMDRRDTGRGRRGALGHTRSHAVVEDGDVDMLVLILALQEGCRLTQGECLRSLEMSSFEFCLLNG